MLRKLLKGAAILLGVLALTAGVLYAFGARIVLDGGGGLHVAFVKSADEQAEAIAKHREAQRAQGPPPAVAAADAPAPVSSGSPSTLPGSPSTSPGSPSPLPSPSPSSLPVTADWPDFRGPARDGHYRGPIRTDWPKTGLTPMWKQPVGGGYASFVAARGRAFTIEQRGSQEVAAAYDIATGRELWTHSWNAVFREMMGGDGPRATPTWSNGRVFVQGATGELRALDDATGR